MVYRKKCWFIDSRRGRVVLRQQKGPSGFKKVVGAIGL
jgi:hypothetical protein